MGGSEAATRGHTLVVPRAHARTLLDRTLRPQGLTLFQANELAAVAERLRRG